jgi:hypothetical protein
VKLSALFYQIDGLWKTLNEIAPPEFFFNISEASIPYLIKRVNAIRNSAKEKEVEYVKEFISKKIGVEDG